MSILLVRQQIDEKLDELSPEMLKAIHMLLYGPEAVVGKGERKEAPDENYEADGSPISNDELVNQINEIDRQVEAGEMKLIPMEESFKKAEKWLRATD